MRCEADVMADATLALEVMEIKMDSSKAVRAIE
jgi:hypothetical protein